MAKRRNKAAKRQETGPEIKHGGNREFYLICAILILATLAVYWQTASFRFINSDDNVYIENNAVVRGEFGLDSIRYAFTTMTGANWMPMVWFSYFLDHSLSNGTFSEEDPRPYHVTNFSLHILNSLLLFLVINVMTGCKWRSGFVALLFAIHPLHVESVAWVAERKDTLSTLFWLLTMLAYVAYSRSPDWRRYALVLGAFILGIMSKSMLVTLPLVLLLLDEWPLRRFDKGAQPGRLVLEKLPLLAISGAACVFTVIIQRYATALQSLNDFPPGVRLANAAVSAVAYLRKTVWPNDLGWQYPHPGATLPVWQVAGSAVLLTALTAAAVWAARRKPYVTVGWFWYIITLVPVIGLVQVGNQGMADRYTYIPLTGIFLIITWGAVELARSFNAAKALPVAGFVVVAALMVVAFHQVGYWRDSATLYQRSIDLNANNFIAHNNLGLALLDPYPSDPAVRDRAVQHLKTALKLNPTESGAHYGLGMTLLKQVKPEPDPQRKKALLKQAVDHFMKAIHLDEKRGAAKNDPVAWALAKNNLGILLWQQGKREEALKHLEAAARACPDNEDIIMTRGYMRQELGLDPETGR